MRFLVSEKLGPHKFKTPEGYLICTDAILSRTGKQEYKRCELFGDACEDPDELVQVDRTNDEVFSDKAMASFENKAICVEHPDVDVNAENHNDLSVGFVRDIHKGEYEGEPVMMGTLVITDKAAIDAVESGEYEELSCGYDCDVEDTKNPQQKNIRGNHVALCKQGRAGIARIIDSVDDVKATTKPGTDKIIYVMQSDIDKNLYFYIGKTFSMKEGAWGYTKFEMGNTTPDELKSELVRNGWHQVTSGPARVIDTSDVMLSGNYVYFEFAEVKGKSLKQEIERKYNSRFNKKIKVKRLDKHWVPGRKEVEIQVFADGMHENYDGFWAIVQATEEESKQLKDDWTEVEEENYNKANKPVGAKDASVTDAKVITSSEHNNIGKDWYGYFLVEHSKYGDFYVSFKIKRNRKEVQVDGTGWNFIKSKGYTSEQKAWIAQHKSNLEQIYGMGTVADSKEQLYTVEFEKDGETFVRKVRAASVEDAIAKAKDGRRLNYDDDIIRVKLNGREVYKGIAEDWIDDSFYDNFKWTGSYYEATNKQGKWVVEVI